ncbi:MAG: ATPase [Anaerolineae bacterium]|nr:ATPase [Anaerolineae bacterium]
MRYVLGVDGGASKTRAIVLASTGQALGAGIGGPCNHQVSGLEIIGASLRQAVGGALREAELLPDKLDVGCFCLAGADLQEDYIMLQATVEKLELCQTTLIENDARAALRAETTRPWGVVVVCGTGFSAMGRTPDGREIRLPSLGPISGDWGGGAMLSKEIIRAVMRAWDGRGKPTLLTQLVLSTLKVDSEETLLPQLYHNEIDKQVLLDLVPLLFDAAFRGDEVATELVVRLGEEVGVTANALIRRLSLEAADVEVVLGGGVFKGKGPLLVNTVTQVIHREAPNAHILPLRQEPVVGAGLLALEAAEGHVTEQQYHRLNDTLPDVMRTVFTPEKNAVESG